jgi:hypothetical protein
MLAQVQENVLDIIIVFINAKKLSESLNNDQNQAINQFISQNVIFNVFAQMRESLIHINAQELVTFLDTYEYSLGNLFKIINEVKNKMQPITQYINQDQILNQNLQYARSLLNSINKCIDIIQSGKM